MAMESLLIGPASLSSHPLDTHYTPPGHTYTSHPPDLDWWEGINTFFRGLFCYSC